MSALFASSGEGAVTGGASACAGVHTLFLAEPPPAASRPRRRRRQGWRGHAPAHRHVCARAADLLCRAPRLWRPRQPLLAAGRPDRGHRGTRSRCVGMRCGALIGHTTTRAYAASALAPDADPNYPLVMVAPEATTKPARCLLKFRRGAFATGRPVCPVLLNYSYKRFNPGWGVVYTPLHVYRLLAQVLERRGGPKAQPAPPSRRLVVPPPPRPACSLSTTCRSTCAQCIARHQRSSPTPCCTPPTCAHTWLSSWVCRWWSR